MLGGGGARPTGLSSWRGEGMSSSDRVAAWVLERSSFSCRCEAMSAVCVGHQGSCKPLLWVHTTG